MKIKKAIFPVGGLGTRFLPATKSMPKEMLPIVDKPLIQYAVEEAAKAGIEQFIFVTSRGKSAIENHFDHSFELENNLLSKGKKETLKTAQEMLKIPGSFAYVRQQEPAGLGHAVWCARHLIGNEPVAVILADDLIEGSKTIGEMIQNYTTGNMLAVMEVDKADVSSYGVITPGKILNNSNIEILNLVEKPSKETAPSNLAVVGRYILEPAIFDVLEKQKRGASNEIQLTDAIASRIGKSICTGYKFSEERFDCGSKLGFIQANIKFSIQRKEMKNELTKWLKEEIMKSNF
ncbi:UTP--glucose-1-phosphate uridylyltransferase GalU [Alphaproteobacteria bacterium]|jgi:UTP--glucose-1-phosphate uridylyltransferase|nr:UTP--glucose-1-phosphate uridylyltransferase GalU [Alphaproteobacteria bacterium]MDB9870050.1 UTP--glucose-1-phosphate uridylyltransferase GalU [Alphaproteobacteria bacterium]|tara:strand:- start:1200 stop:2072 length:873 start_codon:yes stop_codon:yes gene_type:complete